MKEWAVDWEVNVEVTLTKTVTIGRSEVIEAETAEQAVEAVKEEMLIEASDLDLSTMIDLDDFEVEEPDMETFKLSGTVTEFAI